MTINWDVEYGDTSLLDTENFYLLESCRQFINSLAENPIDGEVFAKSATLVNKWSALSALVKWMGAQTVQIRQFDHLLPPDITEFCYYFVAHRRSRGVKVSPKSLNVLFHTLIQLFEQREKIQDGLRFHPFDGSNGFTAAQSIFGRGDENGWIPFIPHRLFASLVAKADRWVREIGPTIVPLVHDVFNLLNNYDAETNCYKPVGRDSTVVRRKLIESIDKLIELKLPRQTDWLTAVITKLPPNSSRTTLLTHIINDVISACAIAILSGVGCRVGELLSMSEGCAEVVGTSSGVYLYFINGVSFKLKSSPQPAKWVAGTAMEAEALPLPVAAIHLMESLLKLHRVAATDKRLFLGKSSRTWFESKYEVILSECLVRRLNEFADKHVDNNSKWRLSFHQFRKSFAWFVIVRDKSALGALGQHFLHVNEAMTDRGYIGTDIELNLLISEFGALETAKALRELLESDQSIGGKFGKLLEEYRPIFRGMTYPEQSEDLRWIVEESDLLVHANDWGLCVTGAPPACGEESQARLPEKICPSTCLSCPNMCVTEEHVPYWEDRRERNVSLMRSAENRGVEQLQIINIRIDECNTVLRDFANV